jgi:hypothetical protein
MESRAGMVAVIADAAGVSALELLGIPDERCARLDRISHPNAWSREIPCDP